MLKRVGKELSSEERWIELADKYAGEMQKNYHKRRIEVVFDLIGEVADLEILDFGCGEGSLIHIFNEKGAKKVYGIDPNDKLLSIAQQMNSNSEFIQGSVKELSKMKENSLDLILSANVLAYLTDEEDIEFYNQAKRILKPGGIMVLTHSNELFDLFTFNKYSVDFFKRYFGSDISNLLSNPEEPSRNSHNIRENPLAYGEKLKNYDFEILRTEFINFHPKPPLISNDDPDDLDRERLDTLQYSKEDKWKLFFQCSTFGVRAVNVKK